ncbi:MAG: lipopolysaccharide biosynthesis glycosyltransferase [uncultured bacterium]|nr:MAG: lipopolysaccharide biosynthesis glycosyltransferase [uncultured bacterium]
MSITVIIHSFNEEKNIHDCISSAKLLTDKIILVDMASTDKTMEIAKNLKVPIFNFQIKSNYVEPAREFGIKQATTEWVLILDADERITNELANEIKSVIGQSRLNRSESVKSVTDSTDLTDSTYYKVPRRNIFAHMKWLKHGGWWPDYQIRLINKKFFVNWPKRIHSTPQIKGNFGYLNNPLTHYFHGNLSNMIKKTIIFEDIESELLYKAGRKTTNMTFFRKFFAELYRRLIKNLGFLDGPLGIIESIYQAFSKTITYLFLYEKQIKKNRPL